MKTTHPIETFTITWLFTMFVCANIDMGHHTIAGALVVLAALVIPFALNSCDLVGQLNVDEREMNKNVNSVVIRSAAMAALMITAMLNAPYVSGIAEDDITREWFTPILYISLAGTAAYVVAVQIIEWISGRFAR